MRIVCYCVDMAIVTPSNVTMEQLVFYGTENDVLADLDKAETIQRQVLIVHANDPELVALARVKLQIINQFKTHDTTKIPMYPMFGFGESKLQDPDCHTQFHLKLRVSARGDAGKPQDITKPVNIFLPAGVRV